MDNIERINVLTGLGLIREGVIKADWTKVRKGYKTLTGMEVHEDLDSFEEEDESEPVTANDVAMKLVTYLAGKVRLKEEKDLSMWSLNGPFDDVHKHKEGRVGYYCWITDGKQNIGAAEDWRYEQLSEDERKKVIETTRKIAQDNGFRVI